MARQRYKQSEVIVALRESKGLLYLAAKKLGCHPNTILNYINRYTTVRDVVTACRGEVLDVAEASLFKAARKGEAWAVQYLLSRLGKDRGYFERNDVLTLGQAIDFMEAALMVARDVFHDPEQVKVYQRRVLELLPQGKN